MAEEAAGGSGKVAEDSSWSSPASTRHNEMKACQGESSLGQGASTEKQLLVGAVWHSPLPFDYGNSLSTHLDTSRIIKNIFKCFKYAQLNTIIQAYYFRA